MNKLILLTLIFVLGGCSWFGKAKPIPPIQIEKRIQPIPVFHPPLPEEVTWQQVEWKVLTPEIMAEYVKDLEEGNAPTTVWYGLTPEGYRALSENVADIQRYIINSNALLVYYRDNLIEIIIEQVDVPVEETEKKEE